MAGVVSDHTLHDSLCSQLPSATLTISSGLLADFARIIGLVKLGIDIRLLGARAFEMWSLWAAVILMFGEFNQGEAVTD